MKHTNILSGFLSLTMCLTCLSFSPASVSGATVITENKIGSEDGYDYELWKDYGDTSMTLNGGGAFSCEWSNIGNALFRKGIKFDCTKTYQELGNITVDYEVDYNPDGNSYMCVYGWSKDPLIEYYIVDSWGSWRPPGGSSIGTITVDGGTYDVYRTIRENQPSIEGNTTFYQYWSVRQTKKTSGTISVSQHFAAWEEMGLDLGKMYECALTIEGYQSNGSANVRQNDIAVGGEIIQPTQPSTEPVEPDKDGYYFHSTFELDKDMDGWERRGDVTTIITNDVSYSGENTLFVDGRSDAWNGTGRILDTGTFVPGQSYSFSVMAMQDSIASENFKLSLQYDLDGETHYDTIAEAAGAKGEWVQLSNTAFLIPEGASGLLLYVETAENLTSFYVDEAIGAPRGTVIPAEVSFTKGDVNHDGAMNVLDVVTLQKYLLGLDAEVYVDTADLTEDQKLNGFDLALLKRMVLQKK